MARISTERFAGRCGTHAATTETPMNQAQLKSFINLCDHIAKRDMMYEAHQSFDEGSNRVKMQLIDPLSELGEEEVGAFFVEFAGEFHGRLMLRLTDCLYGDSVNYFAEAQPEIVLALLEAR